MVRTNLIAPMVLTRATLRHLEASRGYVVNIASTAALNPGHFEPGEDPGAHITPECVADAVAQAVDQREGTVITQIVLRPQRTQVARKARKGPPRRKKD